MIYCVTLCYIVLHCVILRYNHLDKGSFIKVVYRFMLCYVVCCGMVCCVMTYNMTLYRIIKYHVYHVTSVINFKQFFF